MSRSNGRSWVVVIALAGCCGLLAPGDALGWGETGHVVVAEIAGGRLSVQAKRELRRLLGTDDIASRRIPLWADDVRNSRDESRPWHFINIHVDQNDRFDRDRHVPEGGCVVTAIEHFTEVLRDRSNSNAERAEAAKFLIHFVGDIHQPLHCGDRGDKGGNLKKVRLLGGRKSLHSHWDSTLVDRARLGRSAEVFAASLAEEITPEEAAQWGGSSVEAWTNESLKLAKDFGYKGVSQGNANQNLPDSYAEEAVPEVTTQLKKGGVRLAALLNSVLAEGSDALVAERLVVGEARVTEELLHEAVEGAVAPRVRRGPGGVRVSPFTGRPEQPRAVGGPGGDGRGTIGRAENGKGTIGSELPGRAEGVAIGAMPAGAAITGTRAGGEGAELPFAAGQKVAVTTASGTITGKLVGGNALWLRLQEESTGSAVGIPLTAVQSVREVK
jgi:hypothetical protein